MTFSLDPAQFGDAGVTGVALWVAVSRSHGVALITVGGQLDTATASELAGVVDCVLVDGIERHLVIDLSGVAFIDLHGQRAVEELVADLGTHASVDVVP